MYDYGYGSYYSDYSSAGVAALGAMLMVYVVIIIAIYVLQVVAMWKIFTKAGEAGWKSIIPIYNLIVLFKISGLSPLLVLVYLAAIIPFIGWIAVLGINIYMNYNLAKVFGKDAGFTAGLVLLPVIFYMILGFGKDQYVGPATTPTSSSNV